MGRFLKYFLILLVSIILLLWVYIQSHQPVLRGKLEIPQLTSQVDTYFDEYGIPHIYADNAKDAFRAFGYLHAQDRLFQMDLMRRVGGGRLSEIIGDDMKETDAFFRTLGTNRKAKEDAVRFENAPQQIKEITLAYLEGVNEFVRNGKHPLEYRVLGADPEEFTVEDVYCIAGYMAYSFAYALRTDPLVQDFYDKLGPEYLRSLDLAVTNDILPLDTLRGDSVVPDSLTPQLSLVQPFFPDMLPVPMLQGSNGWALGASKTLSGKVMLSNDTHIKYSAPGTWYEAHIEYPGFGFYGNFISGIPVALVGHTRNHAWGLTMFEDDDSDFFVERFANADSSATVYKDSLEARVAKYSETVKVKGGVDTTFTVYETIHGVLINNHLPIKSDVPISMYWNYTALNNELLEAFHMMNRADNLEDFEKGVEMIASPGLNVTYGDASGNIAQWSASKLILRSDSSDGKLYGKGYASGWNFKDYYSFDANPKTINPERDFVHSANQMHDSTEGELYPGYYAPETRADRIEELLKNQSNATVESAKEAMLDHVSATEADVAHVLAEIIRHSGAVFTNTEEMALEKLELWGGAHDLRDVEPTIYYKFLYHTLLNSLQDEVGDEVFQKLFSTHLLKRSYPKMFREPASPWWDDVKTSAKVETRESIVLKSFQKSVMELEDELGADIQSWTWDRVHSLEHPHVFSAVSILKEFFHVGPFPSTGGNETVNNAGFIFNGNGEYIAHYGPAMRIVIDFADIENAVSILPTGNSGNVMSPHYSDQAEMYVNGKFRKMKMNKKEIGKSNNHLVLLPAQKEE